MPSWHHFCGRRQIFEGLTREINHSLTGAHFGCRYIVSNSVESGSKPRAKKGWVWHDRVHIFQTIFSWSKSWSSSPRSHLHVLCPQVRVQHHIFLLLVLDFPHFHSSSRPYFHPLGSRACLHLVTSCIISNRIAIRLWKLLQEVIWDTFQMKPGKCIWLLKPHM